MFALSQSLSRPQSLCLFQDHIQNLAPYPLPQFYRLSDWEHIERYSQRSQQLERTLSSRRSSGNLNRSSGIAIDVKLEICSAACVRSIVNTSSYFLHSMVKVSKVPQWHFAHTFWRVAWGNRCNYKWQCNVWRPSIPSIYLYMTCWRNKCSTLFLKGFIGMPSFMLAPNSPALNLLFNKILFRDLRSFI